MQNDKNHFSEKIQKTNIGKIIKNIFLKNSEKQIFEKILKIIFLKNSEKQYLKNYKNHISAFD